MFVSGLKILCGVMICPLSVAGHWVELSVPAPDVDSSANGPTHLVDATGTGIEVAFVSSANNLIYDDTNTRADIFVRNTVTRTTELVDIQPVLDAIDHSLMSRPPDPHCSGYFNAKTTPVAPYTFGQARISENGRWIAAMGTFDTACPFDGSIILVDRDSGAGWHVTQAPHGQHQMGTSTLAGVSNLGEVLFASTANNLVDNDSGLVDTFVFDPVDSSTRRVVWPLAPDDQNQHRYADTSSADGRYWLLRSRNEDPLLPDNLYRYDSLTGASTKLTNRLTSIAADFDNERTLSPTISDDGEIVVFSSNSNQLVNDDSNQSIDTFIYDHSSSRLQRLLAANGEQGSGNTFPLALSGSAEVLYAATSAPNILQGKDGLPVWFSLNLRTRKATSIAGQFKFRRPSTYYRSLATTNDGEQLFATLIPSGQSFDHEQAFALGETRPQLLSLATENEDWSGRANNHSMQPIISQDGRFVVFNTLATNLVQAGRRKGLILLDRHRQRRVHFEARIHQQSGKLASIGAWDLSRDGSTVAIAATIFGNGSSVDRVYLYDTVADELRRFRRLASSRIRLSGDASRLYIDDINWYNIKTREWHWTPASGEEFQVSNDGRSVVFSSLEALVGWDDNELRDIYLYEEGVGVNLLSAGHLAGNNQSIRPQFVGDDRYIVFASAADNLVPGDDNQQFDWFVYDRQRSELKRLIDMSQIQPILQHPPPRSSQSSDWFAFNSGCQTYVSSIASKDIWLLTLEHYPASPNGGCSSDHPSLASDSGHIVTSARRSNLDANQDATPYSGIYLYDPTTIPVSDP